MVYSDPEKQRAAQRRWWHRQKQDSDWLDDRKAASQKWRDDYKEAKGTEAALKMMAAMWYAENPLPEHFNRSYGNRRPVTIRGAKGARRSTDT